jgi:hypothetical protein
VTGLFVILLDQFDDAGSRHPGPRVLARAAARASPEEYGHAFAGRIRPAARKRTSPRAPGTPARGRRPLGRGGSDGPGPAAVRRFGPGKGEPGKRGRQDFHRIPLDALFSGRITPACGAPPIARPSAASRRISAAATGSRPPTPRCESARASSSSSRSSRR